MQVASDQIADSRTGAPWIVACAVAAMFLAVLVLTSKELYVALGFVGLAVLLASGQPRYRLFILVALLPLAHAGFGLSLFGGFGIYDLYSAIFLFFFLWRIVLMEFLSIEPIPVLRFALLMMAAFLPSLLNTVALAESVKAFVQLLGSILIAAGVFYYLRRENSPKLFWLLLKLFTLVATIVSVYGIYEVYASRSILKILTGRAYFSLFQDVNYYSSYLLMAFAFAAGLALTAKERHQKVLFSMAALVLTVTVVATVSRSALAVLIVVVFVFAGFLLVSQKGARKYLGPVTIGLFVATGAVLVFTDVGNKLVDLLTLSRRVESVVQGRDASFEQRMTILGITQQIIEAHPIVGVGFGAFEKTFDSYQGGNLSTGFGRSAHNTALRILAETGVIGFLAAIVFVVALLSYLVRALRRVAPVQEKTLMFAVIASICSFFMMSLSLDQLFEPHFWVGCGIAIAMAERILRTGGLVPGALS